MWGAWPLCSRAAGGPARRIGGVLAVLYGAGGGRVAVPVSPGQSALAVATIHL